MTRALPPDLRRRFAVLAEARFGLAFPGSRSDALDLAVHDAASRLGLGDPRQLLEQVEAGQEAALLVLADTLTVGETYFFRDPQHFELLRRLLEAADRPVLLWSAGCAGGAEPYTMAIVARQVYGADAARRVRILATDLSPAALALAAKACFRPWSFRDVDDGLKRRWFRSEGALLQVIPEVRDLVQFRQLNLLDLDDPGWPRDVAVAFCRNVLVYFGDDAIAKAASGLRRSLRSDGLLITGPSDPLLTPYGFQVDVSGGFIAHRPGSRTPPRDSVQAAPLTAPDAAPPAPTAPAPPDPAPAPARHPLPPSSEPDAAEALARARAWADQGESARALDAADALTRDHPLLAEGWLLRGLLRQATGRHAQALDDARRALLLDRRLVFAHLLAAPSSLALGDEASARRSLRNARAALSSLPPDREVPGTGATAAELLSACMQMEQALGRARG